MITSDSVFLCGVSAVVGVTAVNWPLRASVEKLLFC